MATRLERFRSLMGAFDITSPVASLEHGHYVAAPARNVADQLAARLMLQPEASFAILGGIGSGKTTQLLMTRQRLKESEGLRAVYLDVAEKHDLAAAKPGVLALLAGLACCNLLPREGLSEPVSTAQARIRMYARGYAMEDPCDDEPTERHIWVPGHIATPPAQPSRFLQRIEKHLRVVHRAVRQASSRQVIVLFDSLDRLPNANSFAAFVREDLRLLRQVGIGVVVATPLHMLYVKDRALLQECFEDFEYLPPADCADARGAAFLRDVLRKRAEVETLPDATADLLTKFSGGVLRDLLMLARAAITEAYLAGAQQVSVEHARAAADQFGRKHIFGLKPDELAVLQRLKATGSFVPTSDGELALLFTRRVLEYQRARVEYALHPTLVPLLDQLADAA